MTSTTEEYLFDTTTYIPTTNIMTSGDYISEEEQHNQITFEIPSHHDLEHIDKLHSFNTLLKRIGNVAYDKVAGSAEHTLLSSSSISSSPSLSASLPSTTHSIKFAMDANGQHITNEQISKSVVLNLADLKNTANSDIDRFFAGAEMHSIINYLWIGVVTSLIILSIIFVLFSCYFYRKFREWKKCNKDIRAHLNNDMYPGGTIIQCDSLMANAGHESAAYYQMESPPCYTIATGLPTYDEALHHHRQHYSFGMQFMYPSIAAVHHQQQQAMLNANCNAVNVISNWEKDDLTLKQRKEKLQQLHHQQQLYQIVEEKQKCLQLPTFEIVATATTTTLPTPPAYNEAATDDIAASVALLSPNSTLVFNDKAASISVCVDAMDDDATIITTRACGDFINVTGNNVFIA